MIVRRRYGATAQTVKEFGRVGALDCISCRFHHCLVAGLDRGPLVLLAKERTLLPPLSLSLCTPLNDFLRDVSMNTILYNLIFS